MIRTVFVRPTESEVRAALEEMTREAVGDPTLRPLPGWCLDVVAAAVTGWWRAGAVHAYGPRDLPDGPAAFVWIGWWRAGAGRVWVAVDGTRGHPDSEDRPDGGARSIFLGPTEEIMERVVPERFVALRCAAERNIRRPIREAGLVEPPPDRRLRALVRLTPGGALVRMKDPREWGLCLPMPNGVFLTFEADVQASRDAPAASTMARKTGLPEGYFKRLLDGRATLEDGRTAVARAVVRALAGDPWGDRP